MSTPPVAPAFERALAAEILASEQMRMRTLAATLAVLLAIFEVLLFAFQDLAQRLAQRPVPLWLPLSVIGPLALYELGAGLALERFGRRAVRIPTPLRFVNALIETSRRLEQLNKEVGSQLLVSDDVAATLGEARGTATPLGEFAIKGYERPVRVWRLS